MALQPVDEFFDLQDFATSATYTPNGGAPSPIKVIFDEPYTPSEVGGLLYQNTAPSALCKTAEVAGVDDQATLVVGGVTYKVMDVQPDGTGLTRLVLSKDTP